MCVICCYLLSFVVCVFSAVKDSETAIFSDVVISEKYRQGSTNSDRKELNYGF